jgi:tRNA A37 methylthiotransferase MiaB
MKDEKLVGHTSNFIKVKADAPKELIGSVVDVKITKSSYPDCVGELL